MDNGHRVGTCLLISDSVILSLRGGVSVPLFDCSGEDKLAASDMG